MKEAYIKAVEGDKIDLIGQRVVVEKCRDCGALMVNLDAKQLQRGDLTTLKKVGVRISNPETDKPICLNCEFETWGERLNRWFEEDDDDDDDSSFFGGIGGGTSSGSLFGGGSFSGFGGFGGGGFGGGGASRSF